MKTKLLALLLVGGSTLLAETNFYFGIGVNPAPRGYGYYAPPPPPPPPPPYARYVPPSPGNGYAWVPGYWVTVGNRHNWRDGYWSAPVRGNGYYRNNGRGNAFGRKHDR